MLISEPAVAILLQLCLTIATLLEEGTFSAVWARLSKSRDVATYSPIRKARMIKLQRKSF